MTLPSSSDANNAAHDGLNTPEADLETKVVPSGNSASSFKANLARFKHVNNDDEVAAVPSLSIGRSGRKRANAETEGHTSNETASPAPSVAKRRRQSSKYAPPEKYAHLKPLTDILEPHLICVFVGFNPGVMTATSGHAYAHPSNMFWKLLHSSGCTDVRLRPEQDVDLPRLYSMGNTNIVARPSKDAAELSKAESAAGTPILEEKIRNYQPEAVCIVGKGIWESIWRWRYGRPIKKDEFHYGWQGDKERMGTMDGWAGARVFVATATSGLAANLKPPEKEAIWKPFGDWVKTRREERIKEAKGESVKNDAR
ncbi:G/U mismatch-specific uracil DNA glycosylase [Fulvia fulva]|uniref:G/U mismatch-specific uracil DNA glycosylase n=1 Tax=Passalora fulva TaxID=5499 RepID=A0A9Q8P767_PASFU|nr:G/U mismatch-specific uracil DNA glycosylase [Fulvia fulva]KAK4626735.1 G/U mismatch-specific uracil DNA glycosylase [Fulvia fulva]KAK4627786.1 G/U mismatch-specific uracil DNA glycosylase [Fulvia fulva]UJO15840.1 G/U mismatch-specific uracil DNA glycosylase [Fulvia fulva]WPV13498.1 G/U mismatch-specific uracil DNA glycosylase [Fulvia fulva]WPV29257.1 G/U mismatch-specific uracil DNA glycosylase [Fulvia fulva]